MSKFPRTLIFTDGAVIKSHGTGALLCQYFSNWPVDALFCLHRNDPHEGCDLPVPFLQVDIGIENEVGLSEAFRGCFSEPLYKTFESCSQRLRVSHLLRNLKKFKPEVFLFIVAEPMSFLMALKLCRLFPDVPVVLKIWDFYLPQSPYTDRWLQEISQHTHSVQLICPELLKRIQPFFSCPVDVEHIFSVPDKAYRVRTLSRSSNTPGLILSGNIWDNGTGTAQLKLLWLSKIWKGLKEQLPGLQPVQWSAHENALKRLGLDAREFPEGIEHAGYYSEKEYHEKLGVADMLFVPFNSISPPESDYARYSIPSRIAEAAALGLSVILLGAEDSAAGAYVKNNKIGCVAPFCDVQQAVKSILGYWQDIEKRKENTQYAMSLARSEFQASMHQKRILEQLSSAVSSGSS